MHLTATVSPSALKRLCPITRCFTVDAVAKLGPYTDHEFENTSASTINTVGSICYLSCNSNCKSIGTQRRSPASIIRCFTIDAVAELGPLSIVGPEHPSSSTVTIESISVLIAVVSSQKNLRNTEFYLNFEAVQVGNNINGEGPAEGAWGPALSTNGKRSLRSRKALLSSSWSTSALARRRSSSFSFSFSF